MKLVIVSAAVAVVASVVTTMIVNSMGMESAAEVVEVELAQPQVVESEGVTLSVSELPAAAAWIRGGSGLAQAEQKILTNAANSACFLTHVEINGIQSEADKNTCSITVDDFTGFWQVNAITGEGTQSELFCNAQCVVWE